MRPQTVTDEQIAAMSGPEIIDTIRRLLEEIELRAMRTAGEEEP